MAVQRDKAYCNFNFLVDLRTGQSDGPGAGFEDVLLPEVWLDVIEYRNGNDKQNAVRKLTGLEHCGNVVLKRGMTGSLNLYQWYNEVRNGDQNALRTVTIQLQNEDHTAVVLTWKLLRARPVKFKCGPLNAKGNDVVIETLELACERLEME
jgi:phage tail-like protein